MITWFDSYVELYTIDPVRIERALRNYEGTDIDQAWKSIRKDVDKINELPEESEEVGKYARKSSLARNLTFLLTAATFAFLLIFLYFQNALRASLGSSVLLIAPGVVIAMMYGALMYNTWTTRKFNGRMREFYNQHGSELRKQTSHIKDTTQLLIDKLQREIYSQNLNPDKFKFDLYHENYRGVRIIGSRRGRSLATIKPKN
jgi:hypothetical protein